MHIQPSFQIFNNILNDQKRKLTSALFLGLCSVLFKNGLETHLSLRNSIISALMEIEHVVLVEKEHALLVQKLFERISYQGNVSWDELIKHLIQCGKPDHALSLYQRILHTSDCVNASGHTYVDLLKFCTKLRKFDIGTHIHEAVGRSGLLDKDLFVGSALIDMYAKCGSIDKAQQVFDRIPIHNTVLWNSLISGYLERGDGEKAIKCFEQMQLEGISPSAVTYVCCLKACGSIGDMERGQDIHRDVDKKGLSGSNSFIGSTLVDMYVKFGDLIKAREVIDQLPIGNIFAWTSLISGYVEHGYGKEALKCFKKMQLSGISPNNVTYMGCLKACGTIRSIQEGQAIHAEIERKGLLQKNLALGSSLVDMYSKWGMVSKAKEVFDSFLVHDIILWNSLIAAFAEHGYGKESLNCLKQMQLEGALPDDVSTLCSLKACVSIRASVKGCEIHAQIERNDFLESNILVGGALIDMYAKCGLLSKAQQIFHTLRFRNSISWNALIAGYTENGQGDKACECYEQMQLEGFSPDIVTFICVLKACGSTGAAEKGIEIHADIERNKLLETEHHILGAALMDMYIKCGLLGKAQCVFDQVSSRNNIVLWNILIAGYAENGQAEEALKCLEQMQLEDVQPDLVALVCSLKACATLGAIDKGLELHTDIERKGFLDQDLVVGSTLVDMYAKCASITTAQQVFDKLPIRDTVSWNALITGYSQIGECESVFIIFDRMLGVGTRPDPITFIIVLNACSRTGLHCKSQTYFESMGKDYGIIPTVEHHGCMIDLLSRAGHLGKAVTRIVGMPLRANVEVWRTLLDACRKWGSVNLGKQDFNGNSARRKHFQVEARLWSSMGCSCQCSPNVGLLHSIVRIVLPHLSSITAPKEAEEASAVGESQSHRKHHLEVHLDQVHTQCLKTFPTRNNRPESFV